MQEKYYIDIDENRKLIGRYLLSFHGENITLTAKEVSEEVLVGKRNFLSKCS